jgi:hypothetical protein
MFELLIAVSGAAFGAVLAIIAFVAWAVRREDACLSMAEDAPGPITRAVRRLLGLHVMGVTGPARPAYHTDRRASRRADWPAHGRDSRPDYWNDPSRTWPADGASDHEDRPAYRIDPPDDWPPDGTRPRRDAALPAGPRS